jgi:hypothetical protein
VTYNLLVGQEHEVPFLGNTTDLCTNVLEKTPILYSRTAVHKDPSKTITNE